jgi:hypothetical protein
MPCPLQNYRNVNLFSASRRLSPTIHRTGIALLLNKPVTDGAGPSPSDAGIKGPQLGCHVRAAPTARHGTARRLIQHSQSRYCRYLPSHLLCFMKIKPRRVISSGLYTVFRILFSPLIRFQIEIFQIHKDCKVVPAFSTVVGRRIGVKR